MKFIELIKRKSDGGYSCNKKEDYKNYGMEILADWFKYDVYTPQTWIDWINDDSSEDTDSNATWLDKYEGNIILGSISDLIAAKGVYKPDYGKDTISVPKDNLIELVRTWEQLIKTKPEKILITEENGVFKMFEVQ